MAVTTKTLTPTGQVVSLPDMTEKPNASILVDGIGKNADAINVLDSNITSSKKSTILQYNSLSDLKNAIASKADTLTTGECILFGFKAGFTDENFQNGVNYEGYLNLLYKASVETNNFFSAIFVGHIGSYVSIGRGASEWYISSSKAIDSKFVWKSLGTLTNTTDTLSIPSDAKEIMLYSDQQYVKASGVFPWSNGTTQYFGISNDTHITNAFINGNSISINAQRLKDGSAVSSMNMTVLYR